MSFGFSADHTVRHIAYLHLPEHGWLPIATEDLGPGSYAKGTAALGSDLDLVAITPSPRAAYRVWFAERLGLRWFAPSDYAADLATCLGLTAAPDGAVKTAVARLGGRLLAFLREHAPRVDDQPDIARYLADGTLERHLGLVE